MVEVDVQEAAAVLPVLLRRVAAGEEITITSGGQPMARLVPVQPTERVFDRDRGLFEVPEDFDDPLPDDVLKSFGV